MLLLFGERRETDSFVFKKCTLFLFPFQSHGILQLVIVSILLGTQTQQVQSFNIDEEYPIVITNSFDGRNSHFGFSVNILERSTTKSDDADPLSAWILIGAPKANSTSENHVNIYEPGVIWRCAMGRKKIKQDDCRILALDPTGEYDPKDPSNSHKDMKDGGWLGAAIMTNNSDRFVSCASRWINQKYPGHHFLLGICYWLPKSHVTSNAMNSSWPWLPPKYSSRLLPLLDKDRLYFRIANASNLTEAISDRGYDWRYGQAGFSVNIPSNNEMILGAPGIFEWTGSVIQFRDAKEPKSLYKRYNIHPSSPSFSEFLVAKLYNDKGELPEHLVNFDYFGYSVTSGNFFRQEISDNRTQYAAGAPRASSMSGKVLIFSFREMNVKNTATLDFLVDTLEGKNTSQKHYGSYFGSVLFAVDVTNDGFDELLVGAPMCGTQSNSIKLPTSLTKIQDNVTGTSTKMFSGDEGCVFVYFSTGDDFMRPPQEICGDKQPGARFGSSITRLGDLNLDGYNDIAIGAPYENEGRGAVYIYQGGSNALDFAQKLSPEKVDIRIRSLGCSLSSGVDIDANHYPDLAVGAYDSNTVVLYRTIPLVNLTGNLSVSIPKLLSKTGEFNVTSCIAFNGINLPEGLGIRIKMSFEREPNQEKLVGWFLQETARNNISNSKLSVSFTTNEMYIKREGSCWNYTAKRIGNIDGLTKSVVIRQDYWLKGHDEPPRQTQPIRYEISNNLESPTFSIANVSQPEFSDFAEKDPISITNMWSTNSYNLPIGSGCEDDGDPKCLANMTLSARFIGPQDNYIWDEENVFAIGSFDTLVLEIDVHNHREWANLPITVDIKWNSPPNITQWVGSDCSEVYADLSGNQHYKCSIKKSIRENQKETLKIDFDMTSIYYGGFDKDYIDIEVMANTSSELVQDVQQKFRFFMKPEVNFSLFDHFNEGSFSKQAKAKTVNFSHTYEVHLQGPTPVYEIQMDYFIPKYVQIDGSEEYKEFLFIRRPITSDDGKINCQKINGSYFEDQIDLTTLSLISIDEENNNITETSSQEPTQFSSRRKKRSLVEYEVEKDVHFPIQCGLHGVECMKIVCTAKEIKNTTKAVIEFKLRLINDIAKHIIPDFGVDFIVVTSYGVVKMLDKNGTMLGSEAHHKFETRLTFFAPTEIAAWILIVAVASGLIILTLVTLILVKCGFFDRKKRDELAALKIKKEIDDNFGPALKKRYEDTSFNARGSKCMSSHSFIYAESGNNQDW